MRGGGRAYIWHTIVSLSRRYSIVFVVMFVISVCVVDWYGGGGGRNGWSVDPTRGP